MKATRDGFGAGIVELGANEKVVVLDADLAESTRGAKFKNSYPERHFQMGISEQDMIGTAAGLAWSGKIPFAATFACFSERGFEQFRTTVARMKLNVTLVGSHAGLITGEDGSSAQALEDMAIYRSLANVTVVSPADYEEARQATIALGTHSGPAYLRLGREKIPELEHNAPFQLGKIEVMREGTDACIIATGTMVAKALAAADELGNVAVLNCSTIKPLDTETVVKYAKQCGRLITCEDHNIIGGLGSAVAEVLSERHPTKLVRIGVQDTFGESGKGEELYEKYGLTVEKIVNACK